MIPDGMKMILAMRRIPLKPRERWVLEHLRDDPKEPLTWAVGGGWWLGDEKVGSRTVKMLQCKVYVSVVYQSNDADYEMLGINEDGRAALKEPQP